MSFLEPRVTFSSNSAWLYRVTKHNSSVFFLSKPLYALDKSIQSWCKFSDFRLVALKLNRFLILFFKPQISFPLNYSSPFSVMTHNSSETFQLKHNMLLTKRAYQCTVFQTFECPNESSHNSSWHFWNKRSGFIQNLHHCLGSWKITPLYFFKLGRHILWTEIAHRSEIFGLLCDWVKIHQIRLAIFETTSQFFIKLCIILQCHER